MSANSVRTESNYGLVADRERLYDAATLRWGGVRQVGMLIEECLELALEARRLARDCENDEDGGARRLSGLWALDLAGPLIEELADVSIMVEQIQRLLCIRLYVQERIAAKCERLAARLEAEGANGAV